MSAILHLAQSWPERIAPTPAGAAGLGMAVLTIVVLLVQQVRVSWKERTAPGPVPVSAPLGERESRRLYWPIAGVLVTVLGVIVIERIVVMT